uniref:Uncharacterized protein n=1 Tax=Seriola lalandi dorsalis TaxID=1841481 RepID=A0A3B4WWW3_SERLL
MKTGDMAVGLIANAVATVGCLITNVMNFLTDMFLTPPLKATLKHLEETELKTLKGGESQLLCALERSFSKQCCLLIFLSEVVAFR